MSKGQKAITEIQTKVKTLLGDVDSDVINDFFQSAMQDEFSKWDSEETTKVIKLFRNLSISFKHVDSHGGEGEGEQYWSVYQFADKNTEEQCWVKFDGWYQSYNGSEFTDWFFVTPKEKLITVYE